MWKGWAGGGGGGGGAGRPADANRLRGEFALVIPPAAGNATQAPDDRVLKLLLAELPLKTAVKLAADITGEARNALYDRALALKQG